MSVIEPTLPGSTTGPVWACLSVNLRLNAVHVYFELLNTEMLLNGDLAGTGWPPRARRAQRPMSVCLSVCASVACCMLPACRLQYLPASRLACHLPFIKHTT